MTGIRHTDVKDYLHCFGFPAGNLADAPVRPCWALPEILSVYPQSPAVTAPVGHAAPLRCAGTSTASVPMQETSLTLRCGPVGPSYLIPGLLSRHSSGAVAFHEVLDLGYCHLVEIPEDGVLET